jgi:hypothetical protein
MLSSHRLCEWRTTKSCPHEGARDSSVSMGPDALAHKEKSGDMAPRRAKDGESGANFSRAPGERLLYSCRSAKESADTMREFPA